MMTVQYKYVYVLLVSCLSFFLVACSNESAVDGGSPDTPGQPVTLRLQIGTATGTATLPKTKAQGDENAKDHEFIHSLVVFVTNTSDRIEKVVPFKFTSEEELKRTTGDLESCTSEEFTLTTGTKRIYAFANCEGLGFDDILKATSGTLVLPSTVTWANGLEWSPGTGNGFIPMSAKEELTVGANPKEISIKLVRLLSRLNVLFRNTTQKKVKVSKWSLGGFQKTIPLFGDDKITAGTDVWEIKKEINAPSALISLDAKQGETDAPAVNGGTYYVSESAQAAGFSLAVTYQKDDGNEEIGEKQTARNQIPRNHIWPIEILFSDYLLQLKGTYGNPPIGGYPLEVETDNLSNMLECTLKGGGPFNLQATLSVTTGKLPATIQWSSDTSGDAFVRNFSVSPEGKITGTMAGSPIQIDGKSSTDTFTFDLVAQDGETKEEIATFSVTLRFKDQFDNN